MIGILLTLGLVWLVASWLTGSVAIGAGIAVAYFVLRMVRGVFRVRRILREAARQETQTWGRS